MKYIKNNGRYALAFTFTKDGREVKVAFDRRRVYLDTGNIATSGITEIEDDVLNELKKNKRFYALLETKEFEEVDGYGVVDTNNAYELMKAKDAEIKKLKAELKNTKEVKADTSEKDKEIKSLKAEIEALRAVKNKTDESEDF